MGPCSQVNVVPTLLDLMGVAAPRHLQGRSLKAYLGGSPAQDAGEDTIIEWSGPNNGLVDRVGQVELPEWMTAYGDRASIEAAFRDPVRTIISPDGWKLNWSPLGEHELYHLAADPLERRNLWGDPQFNQRVVDLARRIEAWQQRTGDDVLAAAGAMA